MEFLGSHILSIDQFDRDDVHTVFRVADEMEPYAQRRRRTRVLEGTVLANLFFEPSTRTRISFGAAFSRLGGHTLETTGFQFSSMAKGESLYDTARVVAGYVDVLVMRHPVEGGVGEFAEATHVPVINGGDGPGEHPTQALLDLYTIRKELGRGVDELGGTRVAMVGDLKHGRTVHSLTKLLSLCDPLDLVFVAPDELQMPEGLVERALSHGHSVRQTESLPDGVADADVIYTTRVQQERFTALEDADKFRGSYSINNAVYEKFCKPGAILLHPLPRDSRPGARELDEDLNQRRELAIFRQTDNGIPVRMALFALVLGVQDRVHDTAEDVGWFVPPRVGIHDVV
jgi:aspartate carbamoyltransferase catalytic subunit